MKFQGTIANVAIKPSKDFPDVVEATVKLVFRRDMQDGNFDELTALMGTEIDVDVKARS